MKQTWDTVKDDAPFGQLSWLGPHGLVAIEMPYESDFLRPEPLAANTVVSTYPRRSTRKARLEKPVLASCNGRVWSRGFCGSSGLRQCGLPMQFHPRKRAARQTFM
jgi:hypothetical protein